MPSRGRVFALTLAIGSLATANATVLVLRGTTADETPHLRTAPADHYIRFETQTEDPSRPGVFSIELSTNLPVGTRIARATASEYAEGGTCCPKITSNRIRLKLVNNDCHVVGRELRGSRFTLTIVAGPRVEYLLPCLGPPGACEPQEQPASVRAVLGDNFERLRGDQVVVDGVDRRLVFEHHFEFPAETCLENPPGSGHY
jgi:hypothetical protein